MDVKKIIEVSLAIKFGNNPHAELKDFINNALDSGEYFDGFEIALQKGPLDYKAYDELFESFTKAYTEQIPDLIQFEQLVDKHLPQSCITGIEWLVTEEGEIVASDELRVAKFKDDKLVWVTNRISWDGIKLLAIDDCVVIGQWYDVTNSEKPWQPLKLSLSDGKLIQGEVLPY
jgi:hypothetical protein